MIRQSPSRNQRSKGIKVKHVLQICFLLAICLWLLYQVKHSHDKKKELDEGDVNISQQTHDGGEILKLGRKDLNPKVEDNTTGTGNHDEEAEDENAGEEDDVKIEEETAEDKTKPEEKGDDIDEHEEDKSDAEVDREEDVVEEDKEIVENDSEENDGSQLDNESSAEERDDDEQMHEAREEHYKADDASSAVTHETEVVDSETENGNVTKSNKLDGTKIVANEQVVNNTVGDQRKMTEEGNLTKTVDNVESKSDNSSESDDHSILVNSTMEMSFGNTSLSSGNVTEKEPELSRAENATTEGTISGDGSDSPPLTTLGLSSSNTSLISSENQADSSLTTSTQVLDTVLKYGEASKTDNGTPSATMPDIVVKPSNDTEEATNNDSAAEDVRSNDGENDASNNGAEEESESASENEDPDEVQHDLIDASDSAIGGLEEKDVRTDLETLPEMQTEGSNDEDGAAAE